MIENPRYHPGSKGTVRIEPRFPGNPFPAPFLRLCAVTGAPVANYRTCWCFPFRPLADAAPRRVRLRSGTGSHHPPALSNPSLGVLLLFVAFRT
jgi:hypothetical protein